jgi:hypothetical protein
MPNVLMHSNKLKVKDIVANTASIDNNDTGKVCDWVLMGL